MATLADTSVDTPHDAPPASGVTASIDRWIWVFSAVLLLATVLAGFVPDSIHKVAMVRAGLRPPFPMVLHVHAVLMASWMILLLAQTTLMATGNRRWHMQLGVAATVLAPAIVLTGIVLVPTMYAQTWHALHVADPSLPATAIPKGMAAPSFILLMQLRLGIVFPMLVAIGFRARRHDPGLHKRLMILASFVPISAAIQRIHWLPSTVPHSPLSLNLYPIVVIAPMFIWDLYRLRRIHRAYIVTFVITLPFVVASHWLWGSPWWLETAPRLLGVR